VKLLFLIFDAAIVYLLLQPDPLPRAISAARFLLSSAMKRGHTSGLPDGLFSNQKSQFG
jgi:hypothetical protein